MILKKLNKTILTVGALTAILAGCGNTSTANQAATTSTNTANAITIQDTVGTTTLPAPAQKVVALEWSFADDLLALGITPVGIADDDKPEAMTKLAGKAFEYMPLGKRETPDLEKITEASPDLIIADSDRHTKIKDQLDQIAPTIVLNSRKGSYAESIDDFKVIAKAVGKEKEAEARVKQHDQIMADLKKQVEAMGSKKVLIGVARKDGFDVHTSDSYAGQVMTEMGFQNAISNTDEPYVELSLETLTTLDPDVIFIATDDSEAITNKWKETPVWKNLKAAKNNQVFMVDRDIWTRFRGITPAEKIGQNALDFINGKVKSQ
ncbi:Fe(3+) dicitrate ABC transporter substrate-binding protein [Paenibacillus kyungheensis]|uniref:Fe(3+) dicitrate ABC transporter substrate-binding protein n=1 Tax=Paenibacillus kyungheensis TaxID=1452732 RepID=A0AAX3LXH2_9BACL|nr:Fe(3+) dicitrate ABC transporter substrate-binding protein [Paenibacillus kyungheensis]WCT54051.1 Fe(3+) dicitrate ABC transporter substrate-binding protein [Paenibacillus kyungheensis]